MPPPDPTPYQPLASASTLPPGGSRRDRPQISLSHSPAVGIRGGAEAQPGWDPTFRGIDPLCCPEEEGTQFHGSRNRIDPGNGSRSLRLDGRQPRGCAPPIEPAPHPGGQDPARTPSRSRTPGDGTRPQLSAAAPRSRGLSGCPGTDRTPPIHADAPGARRSTRDNPL